MCELISFLLILSYTAICILSPFTMYFLLFVFRIWSLCVVIYRFCYVTFPFYFMSAQASLMESFFKVNGTFFKLMERFSR
jgi:hypothetical protein